MQLASKIPNLCGADPPTLQTDGQTDNDMQSQDRALHYRLHRAEKLKTTYYQSLTMGERR